MDETLERRLSREQLLKIAAAAGGASLLGPVGTAQADLYLENQGTPTNDYANGYTFLASAGDVSSITLNNNNGLGPQTQVVALNGTDTVDNVVTALKANATLDTALNISTVTLWRKMKEYDLTA